MIRFSAITQTFPTNYLVLMFITLIYSTALTGQELTTSHIPCYKGAATVQFRYFRGANGQLVRNAQVMYRNGSKNRAQGPVAPSMSAPALAAPVLPPKPVINNPRENPNYDENRNVPVDVPDKYNTALDHQPQKPSPPITIPEPPQPTNFAYTLGPIFLQSVSGGGVKFYDKKPESPLWESIFVDDVIIQVGQMPVYDQSSFDQAVRVEANKPGNFGWITLKVRDGYVGGDVDVQVYARKLN